jgi:hypothetical protein
MTLVTDRTSLSGLAKRIIELITIAGLDKPQQQEEKKFLGPPRLLKFARTTRLVGRHDHFKSQGLRATLPAKEGASLAMFFFFKTAMHAYHAPLLARAPILLLPSSARQKQNL